jgi:exosome complex RNA-binding protein Rrp42 (RNase PH superfamily)
MGFIKIFLESSQTGRSLFVREDEAEALKGRMLVIIESISRNIIDRKQLCIYEKEFVWCLNVDLLVFAELSMS